MSTLERQQIVQHGDNQAAIAGIRGKVNLLIALLVANGALNALTLAVHK